MRDHVLFLGHRTDTHVIYNATDVLALCSLMKALANVVLEAVRSLLRHPQQARMMGARGRDTVAARFDVRRRTRALEALYDAVVAGEPVPAGSFDESGTIDG